MYLPELAKAGRADALYDDALMRWCRSSSVAGSGALQLPPYDEKLLRFEMSLFPDWLLQRHLGLHCRAQEEACSMRRWMCSLQMRSNSHRYSCIATTTRAT
jgi:N-acetylmuramate 1-kinase